MTFPRVPKIFKPWRFHKLAIDEGPEFAKSVIDNTLHKSCYAVSTIESSVADIMNKNKICKVDEAMRETIEITINDKSFDADIGFEMSDGVITDINTIFINDNGVDRNHYWLLEYEDLVKGFIEDIETKLHKRVKDED
jgi:hypothetical protein